MTFLTNRTELIGTLMVVTIPVADGRAVYSHFFCLDNLLNIPYYESQLV